MSSALLQAVDTLNDRLTLADAIGQALDDVAGDAAPALVHVFRTQLEAIRQASEALETLLRGVGGVAPDSGSVVALRGGSTAGTRSVQARPSTRARKPSSSASK